MKILGILSMLFLFSSCALTLPKMATSNSIGNKTGKACSKYIMGFHAGGNSHIADAAKNGGISKVATVDMKASGLWPFYKKLCVHVTGE